METRFKKYVTVLVFLEHAFGQSQLQGLFSFDGFVNKSLTSNQMIVKSKMKCASMCFANDDCYFFDFCKKGTSASCYFHNKDVANMSLLENGECQRYSLKQSCDIENTSPCRCPSNVGGERCNYKYDCDGNLVDWNTPSYHFTKGFQNNKGRDLVCDMGIDNRGWIVIQRRVDGSTDFYRNWTEYENGFGNLATNFYLGNYYIQEIVKTIDYELRIDLQDQEGNWAYAGYMKFFIGGPSTSYKLSLSDYYGNAGDSLAYHNGMQFTTYDRHNDMHSFNCAVIFRGAWWYNNCFNSDLNGEYGMNTTNGLIWYHWRGFDHSLTQSKIMVRKKTKQQLY